VIDDVVGNFHDVGHTDEAVGIWPAPRPENMRSRRIAADVDGVVHAATDAKRCASGFIVGCTRPPTPPGPLGDGQELDAIPQLAGKPMSTASIRSIPSMKISEKRM